MACGTPVLAEANPMMEELIKPGINGALWKGNSESLAKAILTLLEKPAQLKKWGAQAREQLQPTYLQQHCLNQLEQLLQKQAVTFSNQDINFSCTTLDSIHTRTDINTMKR